MLFNKSPKWWLENILSIKLCYKVSLHESIYGLRAILHSTNFLNNNNKSAYIVPDVVQKMQFCDFANKAGH